VKSSRIKEADFIIDKLTNSIENAITGDSFQTDVSIVKNEDLKAISKKNNWNFNWKLELRSPLKEVYKLTIVNNPNVIQGLVSLEIREDHVYLHLLESAPFNKGSNKMYVGVAGNLVAFTCRRAFQMGFEGNVAFKAKTQLVAHYIKSLGAYHIGHSNMIIETIGALKLTNKYFK
jgi:hypothetical protein